MARGVGARDPGEPDQRPPGAPGPADRLHAARRLDWRFLLPDPTLERVAYLGPAGSALAEALELLAAPTAGAAPGAAVRPSFDRVVVGDATGERIADGVRFLAPGGWLYAELRSAGALRRLLDSGPVACVAAAGAAGLESVALHWHWPDFERCLEIAPLDDAATLRRACARRRADRAARLKARLLAGVAGNAIFQRLVPCVSLIGRRPR
jgi:hypothetical protein